MADFETNDNQPARARVLDLTPDATGQAALLLVESLIHGLIARAIITVADAVEIVESATEVQSDIAANLGDTQEAMEKSLVLLGSIHTSLINDLPRK